MLKCPYPLTRPRTPGCNESGEFTKVNGAPSSPERVRRIVLRLQTVPKLWSILCKGEREMETRHYDRNAHQPQQLAALLVMLLGHPDLSPRELVDILNGACEYI